MTNGARQRLAEALERVERDWIGGAYAALALLVLTIAEAIKLGAGGKVQTSLLMALGCLVAFGIWYILRVPDSIAGVFRLFGQLLGLRT
ncbi:hypothetical protein J7643_05490 [bacterium]|nr:hypothetical protein [bacterium]